MTWTAAPPTFRRAMTWATVVPCGKLKQQPPWLRVTSHKGARAPGPSVAGKIPLPPAPARYDPVPFSSLNHPVVLLLPWRSLAEHGVRPETRSSHLPRLRDFHRHWLRSPAFRMPSLPTPRWKIPRFRRSTHRHPWPQKSFRETDPCQEPHIYFSD